MNAIESMALEMRVRQDRVEMAKAFWQAREALYGAVERYHEEVAAALAVPKEHPLLGKLEYDLRLERFYLGEWPALYIVPGPGGRRIVSNPRWLAEAPHALR